MISSVFKLKQSQTVLPKSVVNVKRTRLQEGCHFNSTLDFLVESHKNLLSSRQDFYRSIVESSLNDNHYTIDESFNEAIFNTKNIIRKNIDYLDTCVKKFETQLDKYIESDKYIMKKKDELKNFPNGASFTTYGYQFTFDENVPSVDITGLDLSELKDELESISDKDIMSKITKISDLLVRYNDEKYDNICGEILGADSMTQVDFMNSVFNVYRDGQSIETTLDIGKQEVLQSIENYDAYKDIIKKVKTLQSEIINKYKSLESQVDNIIRFNTELDGSTKLNNDFGSFQAFKDYKVKLANALNNLVVSLTNRIEKISTLHLQAFAGKLDAYNSMIVQDRNILYGALNAMNSSNIEVEYTDESAIDFSIEEGDYDYTRDATIYDHVTKLYELDLRQERFVQECLLLAEGTNIPELVQINEALKMDKTSIFDRIKNFMKKIYEKFLMKINGLIYNDKDFLKKYKDTILKVKISTYTLNDMPDYEAGIKNIKQHKMPKMEVKEILALENNNPTQDAIKAHLLPAFKGSNDEFKDVAKRYFLCDNKANAESVESEKLNMADIYEFCTNANTILSQLKSDKDFVVKETDTIKSTVVSVLNGNNPGVAKAADAAVANDKGQSNTGSGTSTGSGGATVSDNSSADLTLGYDTYYYSSVLESYITEYEGSVASPGSPNGPAGAKKKNNPPADQGTITPKETNPSKENNSGETESDDGKIEFKPDAAKAEKNKDLAKDMAKKSEDERKEREDAEENAKKQAEENKDKEAKKVNEVCGWYVDALKDLYTCKITSFQKIYKEYMKILRYHVKHATSNYDASTEKFTADDQSDIIGYMKDYVNANGDEGKQNAALENIKSAYEAKKMIIDTEQARKLVIKNEDKIKKMIADAKAAAEKNKQTETQANDQQQQQGQQQNQQQEQK